MLADFDKQRIIIALYCINKRIKEDTCIGMECKTGKCLCMDEEQLIMLEQILGMRFEFKTDNYKGHLQAEQKQDIPLCRNFTQYREGKALISCRNAEQEVLEQKMQECMRKAGPPSWNSIINNLPLIQSINKLYNIAGRETIAYWILFSDCSGEFLKKLMLEFMHCAIDDYLEGQNSKAVSQCIVQLFDNIKLLYKKNTFQKCCNKLLESIDQYGKTMEEKKGLHPCKHILGKFYETVQCKKDEWSKKNILAYIYSDNEAEINQARAIYRLLNEVILVTGGKIKKRTNSFVKLNRNKRYGHEIYDGLTEMVINTRKKAEEDKKKILRELTVLLREDVECSSESVEEFKEKYKKH